MNPSPFDALLDDLAAIQAQRTSRDAAARSARHAAEAQRNRKPDWDSLSARQDKIAAEMEQARLQAQQDAIRAHLATLAAAAKAGRLTAHQACLLDVYRGQALAMGLQP